MAGVLAGVDHFLSVKAYAVHVVTTAWSKDLDLTSEFTSFHMPNSDSRCI